MIDYKNHWDKVYTDSEINKLGWYEEVSQPSLELIRSCNLNKDAAILDVGSGVSTLIKSLLNENYSNIYATDISSVALERAKNLLTPDDSKMVKWVTDDITDPKQLTQFNKIDLWHDRTVLHFLLNEDQQLGYLSTLKKLVKENGFVIIAVFSLDGAKKCSGLDVKNYNEQMIADFLELDFKLLKHFSYTYKMPSGNLRPYIYTLFQRIQVKKDE